MRFCNLLPNSSVVFQTFSAMTYLLSALSTSFHGAQSVFVRDPVSGTTFCHARSIAHRLRSHPFLGYQAINFPSFTLLIFNSPVLSIRLRFIYFSSPTIPGFWGNVARLIWAVHDKHLVRITSTEMCALFDSAAEDISDCCCLGYLNKVGSIHWVKHFWRFSFTVAMLVAK